MRTVRLPRLVVVPLVIILSLAAWLCRPGSAGAFDLRKLTLTCPLCQTQFRHTISISDHIDMGIFSPDLRENWVSSDWYLHSIITCPKCPFTASYEDFQEPGDLNRAELAAALKELKTTHEFRRLDSAMVVDRLSKNRPQVVAHLALGIKWQANTCRRPAERTRRFREAITAFGLVLQDPGAPPELKGRYTYLIGEVHRELGDQHQAIIMLERSLDMVEADLRPRVVQQLFQARHIGEPVEAIVTAARKGGKEELLGAVDMLRDMDDPKALAALREFCLKGELAIEALDELAAPDALERHLPVYIAALESDHRGLVDGGADAIADMCRRGWLRVGRFAAPAARPLIKAIQKAEDYDRALLENLHYSLARVDTRGQVDELLQLAEHDADARVLAALIHTGSPKACDKIIAMLRAHPDWLRGTATLYAGERLDIAKPLAAFGDDLLTRMPDLAIAKADDPLALLKIQVMIYSQAETARPQLLAALDRDDELAFRAACALGLRKDPAGRDVLLREIDRLGDWWSKPILELLRPEDLDVVRAGLQRARQRRDVKVEQLRQAATTQSDHELEETQREIEWCQHDEDYFNSWYDMLAATRNPKAKPLLTPLLDASVDLNRVCAVLRLGKVYDKEVSDLLAERLVSETSSVQGAIMWVFADVGDKSHVDLILRLAEQIEGHDARETWADEMAKLAPDRARPIVQRWVAQDPDLGNSRRVRELLAPTTQPAGK